MEAMSKKTIKVLKDMGAGKISDVSILSYIKVENGKGVFDNLKCRVTFPCGLPNGLYPSKLAINGIWQRDEKAKSDTFPDGFIENESMMVIKPSIPAILEALLYVSDDETRYFMNGVYLDWTDTDSIAVVGTDGRRMYCYNGKDKNGSVDNSMILPVYKEIITALKECSNISATRNMSEQRVWDEKKERYTDEKELNTVSMKVDIVTSDYTLTLRQSIEGQYPNYSRVIPEDANTVYVSLPSDAFLKKVKSVNDRKDERVYLKGRQWYNEKETVKESADTDYTLAVNYKYLMTAKESGITQVKCDKESGNKAIFNTNTIGATIVIAPMQLN